MISISSFGDHRLARAVISKCLLADHFAGVAGGVVHRAHARALLGSGVFQERAEYLDRQIARQQVAEDFFFLRLVFIGSRWARFFATGSNTGGMTCSAVGICAITDLKREKEHGRDVEFVVVEARDDLVGDHLCLGEAHLLDAA